MQAGLRRKYLTNTRNVYTKRSTFTHSSQHMMCKHPPPPCSTPSPSTSIPPVIYYLSNTCNKLSSQACAHTSLGSGEKLQREVEEEQGLTNYLYGRELQSSLSARSRFRSHRFHSSTPSPEHAPGSMFKRIQHNILPML